MTTIFRIICGIVWILTLPGCDNYEFPQPPYPRVETHTVVNISDTGATLRATIIAAGNENITNHGFLWGTFEDLTVNNANKVELGAFRGTGTFQSTMEFGAEDTKKYFVKSFVQTESYFVYGKVMAFER